MIKGVFSFQKRFEGQAVSKKMITFIAKPTSEGKILLEKPGRQRHTKEDQLDWLLSHPAKIHSTRLKDEVKRTGSTRELLENWKEELWMDG